MVKLFYYALVILMLFSCSPSGKDVAGIYYAHHENGVEYIEMNSDGTFKQFYGKNSIVQTNKGNWDFININGQRKLELKNFKIYVLTHEDINNSIGRIGTISCYWNDKGIIERYFDNYQEYNYYRK